MNERLSEIIFSLRNRFAKDREDSERFRVILPSGKIRRAREVRNPETIPQEILQKLVGLGEFICESNPTIKAVAYTQIREKYFHDRGLDPKLYSHIIYYSSDQEYKDAAPDIRMANQHFSLSGGLLINPRFTWISDQKFASCERCASIGGTHTEMFIERPTALSLSGHVWSPFLGDKKAYRETFTTDKKSSAVLEHEVHHLQGLDATYFPRRLIDLWNPKSRYRLESPLARTDISFLVFRNRALWLVDYNGKERKRFIR